MTYLATAYSDPNIDIYTTANTIFNDVVDADNFQMAVCTITLSSLHTDASEISVSVYVDGKLLNGQAGLRIKASGATSVHYQLDPIFVYANKNLRIDVQSNNSNDTSISADGTIYKTQQAEVMLWKNSTPADLADTDKLPVSVQHMANSIIAAANIASDAIAAAKIANGAITADKLGADCITSAKIADDAIAAEHIASGAIVAATFAAGAIDASAIAGDAITSDKIADDAIGDDQWNVTSVDADAVKISGSSTAADNVESVFTGTGHTDGVDLSSASLLLENNSGDTAPFEVHNKGEGYGVRLRGGSAAVLVQPGETGGGYGVLLVGTTTSYPALDVATGGMSVNDTTIQSLVARETNGPNTWYVATDGNDGSAGTSWSTAKQTAKTVIEAASDGDTVMLGPGTHTIGDNTITVPTGVSVLGQGYRRTIISSENSNAFVPGIRTTVRDIKIESTHVLGTALNIASGTLTDVHLDRVELNGDYYAFRLSSNDPCSVLLTDCVFESTINVFSVTGDVAHKVYNINPVIKGNGPAVSGNTVCVQVETATEVHLINPCIVGSDGLADSETIGVSVASLGVIYITGGSVITESTGTCYDVKIVGDSGNIYASGFQYDDDKVNGTGLVDGSGDWVQTKAEAAIDSKFTFVGDGVRSAPRPMTSGIGSDEFLFTLSVAAATPKVLASDSDEEIDRTATLDADVVTTRYTSPTLGTQWQLTLNILQHDPGWTEEGNGDPYVVYSSSDEDVATVTSEGLVEYVGEGTCTITGTSNSTDYSPARTFSLEITNAESGGDSQDVVTYEADDLDASKHILIVYNADSTDSETLKDYYIANRPGMATANVLGLEGLPDATSTTSANVTNLILDPLYTWLTTNEATKPIRYIVFMRGIPSRQGSNGSVGYMVYDLLSARDYRTGDGYKSGDSRFTRAQYQGATCLPTWIDMGSYAASTAYIDKLKACGDAGGTQADGITLDGSEGGVGGTDWLLCGNRELLFSSNVHDSWTWTSKSAIEDEGISSDDITEQRDWDGELISSGENVTYYQSWGIHSGEMEDEDGWPTRDFVQFTGNSGWWILKTIESYNGIYGSSHGDPEEFFGSGAFGGEGYENIPVGFVGHTAEPGLGGVSNQLYAGRWAKGWNFIEAAWVSRGTHHMLVLGDPLVRR